MDNKAKERERLELNGAIEKYLTNGGTIKKLKIQSQIESDKNRMGQDDFEYNDDNKTPDSDSLRITLRNYELDSF